jgi:anti-sigma B factor antagonist
MNQQQIIAETESLADGKYVRLSGDIDLSRSPELRNHLLAISKKKPARLVVDLSDVPYMDSSGVATLVETLQQQRRNQGRMILCCMQQKVRSIFEIARLDMVFTIVDDKQTATTM